MAERYPESGGGLVLRLAVVGLAVGGLGRLGVGLLTLLQHPLQGVRRLLESGVGVRPEVGRDAVGVLRQRVRATGVRLTRLDPRLGLLAQVAGLRRLLATHRSLPSSAPRKPKVVYDATSPAVMPCSTFSSCGTTGSGNPVSGNHARSAHLAGSTIRGVPDHDVAVKKKSIR